MNFFLFYETEFSSGQTENDAYEPNVKHAQVSSEWFPLLQKACIGLALLICNTLAELEHDTSLVIMDNYDKSFFWAFFAMIYHCL